MQYLENEIRQITEWVWHSVLERQVEVGSGPEGIREQPERMLGSVFISGSWHGAVSLHCSQSLARQAASKMFNLPEESVDLELTRDALGELTNIVGGNVKSLLPSPSQLSVPMVQPAGEGLAAEGKRILTKVDFESQGEPFTIVLAEG